MASIFDLSWRMVLSNSDNPLGLLNGFLPGPAEETSVTGPVEFDARGHSIKRLFDSDSPGSDAQHAAFDQADQQGGSGVETLRGGD